MSIKRIDIKDFREQGYLREVNRKFFHRLGMALEIIILDSDLYENNLTQKDFNNKLEKIKNKIDFNKLNEYESDILEQIFSIANNGYMLGGVWDYREDPEGMIFGKTYKEDIENAKKIEKEMNKKPKTRKEILGFDIQPLTVHKIDKDFNLIEEDLC